MLQIWDKLNGEMIQEIIHKHPFPKYLTFIFFLISIILTVGVIHFINKEISFIICMIYWQIFLAIFYYISLWHIVWNIFICSQKIICVYASKTFKKDFIEVPINEIQEVKAISQWFFQNIFWYGTLQIIKKWTYEHIKITFLSDIINKIQILQNISKK